jgi:transcriptional regulator of acetoin/glycerol metabolism
MMTMREQQAIRRLSRLGERRARLAEEQDQLADEIRQALIDTEEYVNRSHAADLLGIERSTLYRVYLPQ